VFEESSVSHGSKHLAVLVLFPLALAAQTPAAPPLSLTIYNHDFAVARTTIDLDLKPGESEVTTTEVTSQVEPDSVILRDPTGRHAFLIAEQNYDAAIVNQDWLLQKYEGKTLDFASSTYSAEGKWVPTHVQAKVLRANPPLIERDGKMIFQLPGTPEFPAGTDGLLLKPTLRWQIHSEKAAHFPAEFSYITRGFTWSATYNLVAAEGVGGTAASEPMDMIGWVTLQNNSGVDYPAAKIQLLAGDVAKLQEAAPVLKAAANGAIGGILQSAAVTQQNLDEFHLYDLNRTTPLRNGEQKQVQFLEGSQLPVKRSYEYDGAPEYRFNAYNQVLEPGYGLGDNTRVLISNEFVNSEANHLGVPMPAGRMRLYRRDKSGAMQFVGESEIMHTPRNEKISFVSGAAFDIVGKRTQTDFHLDQSRRSAEESFAIEIKNRKDQPVDVRVVEHLYRAANWEMVKNSADYARTDSHDIAFVVHVKPDATATVNYTAHYSW
jgi:hypothetical protein